MSDAYLPVVPPADPFEERERAGLARLALEQLSAEEQAFVVECFHEERSPQEIARRRGITVNTAYARKFKLREKLKRITAGLELLSQRASA
jgi:DNA-directed RNA polymerase specialized sigma24 family protein